MNFDNLKKVRKFVEKLPEDRILMSCFISLHRPTKRGKLTMRSAISRAMRENWCGTYMCFAGTVVAAKLAEHPSGKKLGDMDGLLTSQNTAFNQAKNWLDLTESQAKQIFYGGTWNGPKLDSTIQLSGKEGKDAILKQIDYMLATGLV